MAFNDKLLYKRRPYYSDIVGVYKGTYYNSDDIVYTGRDGQHIRFTFNDDISANIIEIFSLAKTTDKRYSNSIQQSYGKILLSNKNFLNSITSIQYNNSIINSPKDDNVDYSTSLFMHDYNILYSEKGKNKLQNSVLGNELVKTLNSIVDILKVINTDIGEHIHNNVVTSSNYRATDIGNKLDTIKKSLNDILSDVTFNN